MNAVLKNVMVPYGTPVVHRVKVRNIGIARPNVARHVALAVAAPFIGLAYVIAFPVVGLAMLAWMGAPGLARWVRRVGGFARNVTLFLAAPFIGLAYAIAFPFVGIVLLARWAVRAAVKGHVTP